MCNSILFNSTYVLRNGDLSGGLVSTHVALISLIVATHGWAAHSRVSAATQTVWRASLHTPSITCVKHNDRTMIDIL